MRLLASLPSINRRVLLGLADLTAILLAVLLTGFPGARAQSGPAVTAVAVSSSPSGGAYSSGETIRVALTFSQAVGVDTADGIPRLNIDMDPADWGTKWAS